MTKKSLIFILIFLLSSCSSNQKFKPLHISFSSSESSFSKALKKRFNISLASEALSEDKALKALLEDKIDAYIGTLNIPAHLEKQIDSNLIAKDGLIIVTNPQNPIDNLSLNNLKDIFSREANNWSSFGGKNEPIIVIDREASNIQRQTLYHSLFGLADFPVTRLLTVSNTKEIKSMISKFPNAISYINYTDLSSNLKTIDIENIAASPENIREAYFPLSRPVKIYYKKDHLKQEQKLRSLKKLLSFVYSDEGKQLLVKNGLISLSQAELAIIKESDHAVYIGVAAPLEGPYIDLGKSIVEATKLAVEEINNKGGINGADIEIIVCNDKANLNAALDCANKFIEAKVIGVIGHLTSQSSIETSKIYVANKIIQISPASTHPWFTERPGTNSYVFRTAGRDDKQAKLIVDLISSNLNHHPARVTIFNNGTIYGSNLASLISNEISKRSLDKIVLDKAIEPNQGQYHNEVQALKTDILVFVGESGDGAQIVKELALSNKSGIVFIGADGIFSHKFIEKAGLRAEGTYVTGNVMDQNATIEFQKHFKDKFNNEASAFAMNSYDATYILLDAYERSLTSSLSLVDELKATNHKGITGSISFDKLGDPILPRMCIYKVQSGKFTKIDL